MGVGYGDAGKNVITDYGVSVMVDLNTSIVAIAGRIFDIVMLDDVVMTILLEEISMKVSGDNPAENRIVAIAED